MDNKYTAYCGLCCTDCIPSNTHLFSLAHNLEVMLENLQFEEYAKLKSLKNPIFNDYSAFLHMLREIKSLECNRPCREGGGDSDCRIKRCVQSKGLEGCWQCGEHGDCKEIGRLKQVHPNLEFHLQLIKECGPKDWLKKRKAHYGWQREKT
jgi:hypothetical protein